MFALSCGNFSDTAVHLVVWITALEQTRTSSQPMPILIFFWTFLQFWWAAARTLSAEGGSTAERRAAFGSKVIYKCGQPHGTVKVRAVDARHNDIVLLWSLCQALSRLRPQQLLMVRSKIKIFLIYVLTFLEDVKMRLQIRALHHL